MTPLGEVVTIEQRPVGARVRQPRIAAGLSVIPGLGQLYTAQPRKALFFLGATVVTLAPAIALITSGERAGNALLQRGAEVLFLLLALASVLVFLVLFILGLFFWASAAIDAHHSARALNSGLPASRRWFFRL